MMTKERISELSFLASESLYYGSPKLGEVLGECLDEIESLQSRVQDLEKDKARLGWLHDKQHSDCFQTYEGDWLICHYIGNQKRKDFRAKTWREAIDAAMKGTHEENTI